jgi:hypothetical protein
MSMNRTALALLAALAAAGTVPAQFVMTINATTDQLVTFDPVNGALQNAAFFPIPNTTQVSAIDVNGEIWISEQTGDRITRRDPAGNVLSTIGPTFAGGGFDNIRGMCAAYGFVYVTNAGAANGGTANSVVILDTSGAHVSTFSVNTLATSPFGVIPFNGDVLVSGFNNTMDVYRFTALGTPVGVFHDSTAINLAHGLARAGDGSVWCVGFTNNVLVKLDQATGAVLMSVPGGSTSRGVYELGNGNLLWTDGAGVHLYDMGTSTSSLLHAGACYHLNGYGLGGGSATATPYGTGCDGLSLATSGLPQLGNGSFSLLLNNVPFVSPIGLFGFGTLAVNPGVALTPIGMPGCFAYTNLDIGLFSGSLVSSGTSTFALPIPGAPSLSGAFVATQGLSFSALTPAGLAASNGMSLVLGN